jgi:hypothetical protein
VELQQCLAPGYRTLRCTIMLLIRASNSDVEFRGRHELTAVAIATLPSPVVRNMCPTILKLPRTIHMRLGAYTFLD